MCNGKNQSVKSLIIKLNDKTNGSRNLAADSLGIIGSSKAVEHLVIALCDSDMWLRKSAANALGLIGDSRAINPLINALNDGSWQVKRAAAEALGTIRDLRAVEPLIMSLKDSEVRKAASIALGKIRDPRAIEPLLTRASGMDCLYIVESLKNFGVLAVNNFIDILDNRADNRFKYVVSIIGYMGDYRAVKPLISLLCDIDPTVRREAAQSLGNLADTSSVEPLINTLKDSVADVRATSAWALGRIEDRRAVAPLISLLPFRKNIDYFGEVRNAAVVALGVIGDSVAVEPLISVLKKGDYISSRSAAKALARIGCHRAVEALSDALTESSSNTRIFVAEALDSLKDRLSQKDLLFYYIAQQEPRRSGEPVFYYKYVEDNWITIKPLLLSLLRDRSKVQYAVSALMLIGKEEVIPEMINAMNEQEDTLVALTYLNCGQPSLQSAAQKWCKQHGYSLFTTTKFVDNLGTWNK